MAIFKKLRKFRVVFLLCTITTASLVPLQAFAIDTGFYSSNDVLFYNPDDTGCAVGGGEGTVNLTGNDNLEKILRYLVGKGLTLSQASGIAGNIGRESGFNPAKIQGGAIAPADYTPVNSVGFGLAQWTFTDRQSKLVALSKTSNRQIIDLGLQLDYMWQELHTNRAGALPLVQATTTPDNAAYVFHNTYEGSNDTPEQVRANRGGDALAIFAKYQLIIPDSAGATAGTTNPTTGTTATCTGSGASTNFATNFTVYNQNDPKWADVKYGSGTVGPAGCGPSAMAMIITNITGQAVTPADTATYGAAHGTAVDSTTYGTAHGTAVGSTTSAGSYHNIHQVLGDHYGLKYTQLTKDVTVINQGLRDGGLVIMAGTGSVPFTSFGHIIVIRAVTADGKWLIGDSNGAIGQANSANTKEWDPAAILSMVDAYIWLMKK
jgi:hypothetical protein